MQQCEDLEDTESLHHLYTAMKGIVMLNDITLLELLFSEAHVMDVVRCCWCTELLSLSHTPCSRAESQCRS